MVLTAPVDGIQHPGSRPTSTTIRHAGRLDVWQLPTFRSYVRVIVRLPDPSPGPLLSRINQPDLWIVALANVDKRPVYVRAEGDNGLTGPRKYNGPVLRNPLAAVPLDPIYCR